jgi:antitoxin (DNA-binding transcriptional repressor) of toxin-antitoxin stability system
MSDVRIADLKARLSEHLQAVRNGGTVTVLDRDTPIARIVRYAVPPLEIRKAQRRVRDLKLPPKPAKRTDSLAVMLEDRSRRMARLRKSAPPTAPGWPRVAYSAFDRTARHQEI